jgi:Uma2 family endonuclease
VGIPPITVEQYLGFEGPEGYRDELINGRIVVSPRPKPLHCDVMMNIFRLLRALLVGQPYGAHLSSNIQLGPHNMPSPDVFIVPNDVWRRACDMDEYLAYTPLLVAEVVSCANTKENVEEKTALYLSQGVPMVWIVYPSEKNSR